MWAESATSPGGVHNKAPIAIVGMSCLFPMAPDAASFWQNIVSGADCLREASPLEWEPHRYASPDGYPFKKIYCVRGGFVSELADFDPLKFGVMPKAVEGADPDQFLTLKVAVEAMQDAGYAKFPVNLERGEVILGRTSAPGQGAMNMIQHGQTVDQVVEIIHRLHPEMSREEIRRVAEYLHGSLKPANADTVPGVMPNILAGRIASRLGFRGKNMLLDAACASSLIAVETAVNDLRANQCDFALAGGIHINSFACFYQMFCALTALSPSQSIRPFDENADGTILGEGIGVVALKRLSDALAEGDRVYAVIRGIGSSSDGHGTSMLAPSVEGESLAIRRAIEDAGVSPRTISLIEAHGTGTPAGDAAELKAIAEVYGSSPASGSAGSWIALGSVKSMIGHTQAAAGIAGLIKAALALYHRVLPPSINVNRPTLEIDWTTHPCYINTKAVPWLHPGVHASVPPELRQEVDTTVAPRRAAVSAFGFGGVNAHVILEEHADAREAERPSLMRQWDSELLLIEAENHEQLLDETRALARFIAANPSVPLKDVAFTLSRKSTVDKNGSAPMRLALVAASAADLAQKLKEVQSRLERHISGQDRMPAGAISEDIYSTGDRRAIDGRLGFVLPGLGAAYPNMLADLCIHFPDVRAVFDYVDQLTLTVAHPESQRAEIADIHHILPSRRIFTAPPFARRISGISAAALASMDSAVVTVILAEWALFRLLERLGIKADAVLGVSTGEFAALTIGGAANILDAAPLFYKLSTAVAKAVPVEELARLRSIKVSHPLEEIEPIINKLEHPVYLGADLSPAQVLLSGTKEAMELAQKELKRNSLEVFALPTAIPYHTPLVSGKVSSTDEEVGRFSLSSPSIPIWGCSVVGKYPGDEAALKEVTTKLFTRPIHFRRTIESMYADGVRKFVEVGPKGSLSAIINEILGEQPHLSVASNLSTTSAITQLNRMLAALSCHGVQMDLAYIFERRDCRLIDFSKEKLDARSPSTIRLSLKYPEIALDNIPELPNLRSVAETAAAVSTPAAVSKPDAVSTPAAVSAPDAVSAPKAVSAPDAASISILPLHPQEQIMTSYLADLTTFHRNLLSVQAQVLSAYLARSAPSQLIDPAYCGAPTAEAAATGSASAENGSQNFISRYPLLASALVRKSQSGEIEVLLPLTLTTHQYLLDHAIGGNVLHNGTMPERVYLVPLTVALEMMTEVASLLAPGMVPVKIEAVRALRRIRVTGEGLTLRLVVREEPGHSNAIASAIYIVDAEAYGKSIEHMPGHPSSQTEPAMSCTVWFASAYQAAAPATIPEVANGREARIAGPSLYTDTTMFHGPRMQSVVALEKVGDKTISGYVAARKAAGWLADANGAYGAPPAFQIDPLLLDNSTQLVLYHLFEQNDNVSALLPFHIDSLELFADLSALSGQAKVWANVKSRNSIGTEADVEIYSPANHLLARFNSISSKRISLPERWKSFIAHPAAVSLGIPAADVLSLLPTDGKDCYECTEVSDALLPADEATLVWLTDYLLHPKEQSLLAALSDRRRKREWLAGRIAAKDAIRQLVARKFGRQIPPANIVVQTTESGTPYSHVALAGNSQAGFALSITHKNGLAIALAKLHLDDQPTAIGIDFEPIVHRESSFERFVVGHNEQSFLKGVTGNTRLEALTALWCAKEAAGKALGVGLSNNPRKLEAKRIDLESQHALFEGNLSDDAASPSKVVDVRWLKREAGIIASAVASLRLFAP